MCLYLRTCIFRFYMFIMILWKKTMSTPLIQNPCLGIKNSNWTTHRTWHVGIGKATSTNGRRHQQRPARIWCGMCASGKRRWPTTCSIIQGLHASAGAGVHRIGEIAPGQRASVNRLRSWSARIERRHRPMASSIRQGMHASVVACAHRLGDIGVGQQQEASANACTHRTWHVRIWQKTSANGMWYQPRLAHINRGMCASPG